MRILYTSCHAVLEYDELRMLRSLGHVVFPVGAYFGGNRFQAFRPALPWGPEEAALLDKFHSSGCRFGGEGLKLTPDFISNFDASIVMHDPAVLEQQWEALQVRPVAWRTIGQGLENLERRLAPLRKKGMRIIRYSEIESLVPGHLGSEGLVRFGKDPTDFGDWTGESSQVVTFANDFAARYPREHALFSEVAKSLPIIIGGRGNDELRGSIGLVSHEEQCRILRDSRAYFYCSGLHIPYTLNFIEAWMTGIPVVVLAESALNDEGWLRGRRSAASISEIERLVVHGETGFIARTIGQARRLLSTLLDDHRLASRVGAAGRAAAISIFGAAVVRKQWEAALGKSVSWDPASEP